MYFTAAVDGHSHLWRQRFPSGQPEQLTFGPTEEEGVAVEPDGRSVITAMGTHESAIWIHDPAGERSLSSEGEIVANPLASFVWLGWQAAVLPPSAPDSEFGPRAMAHDDPIRQERGGVSGHLHAGLRCIAGRQTGGIWNGRLPAENRNCGWLRSIAARPPNESDLRAKRRPHFGPRGQILFQLTEGNFNYLEQMNLDGSARSKVVPYPISSDSRHLARPALGDGDRAFPDGQRPAHGDPGRGGPSTEHL